jgi:hypothetical protein
VVVLHCSVLFCIILHGTLLFRMLHAYANKTGIDAYTAPQGRPDEAQVALQSTQGISEKEAIEAVSLMTVSQPKDAQTSGLSSLGRLVETPGTRKALAIGVGLVLLQQLSGQPSVLYYANRIFDKAGLGFEAAVAVGLFKGVTTLLSVALVENPNFGRRTLLITGTSGMTVSLLVLAGLFVNGPDSVNQAAVLAAVFAYVGSYQVGFGPITWLILSEIFPLSVGVYTCMYVYVCICMHLALFVSRG